VSGDTKDFQISVQVFEEFEDLVSEDWLRAIASRALAVGLEGASGAFSVVIADDETVRELNKTYRGLDKTTDVLSFAFDNQGEYYGEGEPPSQWSKDIEFILPPGESLGLGEVIISYPQAVRQAREAGRSVRQELAHLLAHGVLHVLGHDHMEPDEEAAMNARESAILAQVTEDE
jgi:probable rRNA maturation factor